MDSLNNDIDKYISGFPEEVQIILEEIRTTIRQAAPDAAMPVGLTAYALTQQYNLNAKLAGRLVMLSTFLS